jgi:hypothetical protein
MAEFPEKKKSYINAVNLVLKMAKENHQVSVTLSETQKFYEEAIKENIYSTLLGGPLTVEEQKKGRELLLAYMVEPASKNAWAFKNFKNNLGSYAVEKSITLMDLEKKYHLKLIFN